ncbi:C40 family peptidase [Amycolatopsis samaneae]|uniref:C40 family peptidase n=1 Tax=Amycolatopsis samaneae TaxID=664691 RepID=A0ABW5GYE5_9PSEU
MNPLLALRAAELVRDKVREHPLRWGCVAVLVAFGPLIIGVLVVSMVVMLLAGGADEPAAAAPEHVPGIPDVMLAAYVQAAQHVPTVRPGCAGMRWAVLAGIAREESRHAAGHTITPNGNITPPILGPVLDGSGVGGNTAPIRGQDGKFARAVGPFQFLTTTWATIAQDGNHDGVRDPQNAFDAALGAAVYLCGDGPRNLGDESQLRAAVYRYNASWSYVDKVIASIYGYDTVVLQPDRHRRTAPAAGAAKTVIDAAMAQRGVPYAWGGSTANGRSQGIRDGGVADAHGDYNKIGFDCSGLALYAYAQVGITLPRTADAQFATGTRIPKEAGLAALKPADLVFYSPGGIHHVGIYLGNGQMINAYESGTVIRVDTVNMGEYAGAVRLL